MNTPYLSLFAARLAGVALLALTPALVFAQPIYRIVGPDGRVSFSDKPPASNEKATSFSPGGRSSESAVANELPFDLREAVNRYPVTLYTGNNCEPCATARSLLNSRGIPHSERTVTTALDVDALKRLGLEPTVPTATIGGQRLKGYSEAEWNDFLDAAGYPKTSRLPSGYRNPPIGPLVPLPEAAPASAPRPAAAPAAPSAPPSGPTPDNPTGIVF